MKKVSELTRKEISNIFRTGNQYVKNLIGAAENPIFSMVIDKYFNEYIEWSNNIPFSMRMYFDDLLEDLSVIGYLNYTKRNIRMCDGKLYTKEEINYYATVN